MEWASFFIGTLVGLWVGVGSCAYWAYKAIGEEIIDEHVDI